MIKLIPVVESSFGIAAILAIATVYLKVNQNFKKIHGRSRE